MAELNLSRHEKNVLNRIQQAIIPAKTMTDTILRDLIDEASKDVTKDDDFRFAVVDTFVNNWWHYVGQWEWPQVSVSRKVSGKIAKELMDATFPDGVQGKEYADWDMDFTPVPEECKVDSRCACFAEIRPKKGRESLWPCLYLIPEYGVIPDAIFETNYFKSMDDIVVSFAVSMYPTEVVGEDEDTTHCDVEDSGGTDMDPEAVEKTIIESVEDDELKGDK